MPSLDVAPLLAKRTLSAMAESTGGWTDSTYVGSQLSSESQISGGGFGATIFEPKSANVCRTVILRGWNPENEASTLFVPLAEDALNFVGRSGWVIVPNHSSTEVLSLSNKWHNTIRCLTIDSIDTEGWFTDWWRRSKTSVSAWTSVELKIEKFASYEHGWDGGEASVISAATVELAKALVARLRSMHAPAPKAAVAYDDGEVELQWRSSKSFGALSIDASQRVVGFVRASPGRRALTLECEDGHKIDLAPFVDALNAM